MSSERDRIPDLDCEAFVRALRAHEARSRGPAPADDPTATDALPSLEALCGHVKACGACRRRYRRRVAALDATIALKCREIPAGTLDDLYDAVRARTPFAAPGGGMSTAFLDAPRALRAWRNVALAASVLLVVGGGVALTGGFATERTTAPSAVRPLRDPRSRLLETFRPIRWSTDDRLYVRPVPGPMQQGRDQLFRMAPAQPVDHVDENGREIHLR